MHKTTIMLPLELKLLAEQEAHRLGISLGEVIRISLKNLIASARGQKSRDALFDLNIVYQGPCEKQLSLHHDDYLYGKSE